MFFLFSNPGFSSHEVKEASLEYPTGEIIRYSSSICNRSISPGNKFIISRYVWKWRDSKNCLIYFWPLRIYSGLRWSASASRSSSLPLSSMRRFWVTCSGVLSFITKTPQAERPRSVTLLGPTHTVQVGFSAFQVNWPALLHCSKNYARPTIARSTGEWHIPPRRGLVSGATAITLKNFRIILNIIHKQHPSKCWTSLHFKKYLAHCTS